MPAKTSEAVGWESEVARGERFRFGDNWQRFAPSIDDERIEGATRSLRDWLGSLEDKRFVDVGSGSGLFSLAARRLGATVVSFDYDQDSVACTAQLKARHLPDDPTWVVEQGSILDRGFLEKLGKFDVVYSWGVLHHTGDMEAALANAAELVAPGGLLFIAIYNDQGGASHRWRTVKRAYNRASAPGKLALSAGVFAFQKARGALIRAVRLQNPFSRAGVLPRGMAEWRDLVDWVGGWPFEVARPEEIFDFYRSRGFALERLRTCGSGHGCNEYLFRR